MTNKIFAVLRKKVDVEALQQQFDEQQQPETTTTASPFDDADLNTDEQQFRSVQQSLNDLITTLPQKPPKTRFSFISNLFKSKKTKEKAVAREHVIILTEFFEKAADEFDSFPFPDDEELIQDEIFAFWSGVEEQVRPVTIRKIVR